MGISVNTNMMSLNVAKTFNRNTVGLQNSMEKLSTGMRINSAGDDPSGLALSQRLNRDIDSLGQANKNIQNDTSLLHIAEDATSNIVSVLQQMRTLTVQIADETNDKEVRLNLVKDFEELRGQIDNIVDDTKWAGKSLFKDGSEWATANKGIVFQYGKDSGDNMTHVFDVLDTTANGLNLTTALTTTAMNTAINATPTGSNSAITGVTDKLDTAINTVLAEQTKLGIKEQRLGYISDGNDSKITALTEMNSNVRDQDVATGMTEFMRYNIRTQTSQLMLAQAGQVPAMVLKLLEP